MPSLNDFCTDNIFWQRKSMKAMTLLWPLRVNDIYRKPIDKTKTPHSLRGKTVLTSHDAKKQNDYWLFCFSSLCMHHKVHTDAIKTSHNGFKTRAELVKIELFCSWPSWFLKIKRLANNILCRPKIDQIHVDFAVLGM